MSQSSIVRRYASVKFFYEWLRSERLCDTNPADSLRFKMPKREPRPPFTDDELRRMLSATGDEWHRHKHNRARDRALLLVLASGVRLGELHGMRAADLDWDRGLLKVRGKGMRSRWVALGEVALAALRDLASPDAVWASREGRAISAHGLYLTVKRIAERAGVAGAFPHRFRTTFACDYYAQTGGDFAGLRILMGHSKPETTEGYIAWNAAERALAQQRRLSLADRL